MAHFTQNVSIEGCEKLCSAPCEFDVLYGQAQYNLLSAYQSGQVRQIEEASKYLEVFNTAMNEVVAEKPECSGPRIGDEQVEAPFPGQDQISFDCLTAAAVATKIDEIARLNSDLEGK